jgi:hypothetical protein
MGELDDITDTPPTVKKGARADEQVRLAREHMPRLDEMYNSFDFECKQLSLSPSFPLYLIQSLWTNLLT